MNGKVNCGGQSCPERNRCRRFVERIPDHYKTVEGIQIPVFAWASLDIERQIFGTCENRIHFRQAA